MPMASQPSSDEVQPPGSTFCLDPIEVWLVLSRGETVVHKPVIQTRSDNKEDWLAKEGLEVLRTSCRAQHLRLICEILRPAISIRELSNRWKIDVESLVAVNQDSEHYANNILNLSAVEYELLEVLRCRKQPFIPECEWDNIKKELDSGQDARTITENIDHCISRDFAQIPFSSWVQHVLGYKPPDVSYLLRRALRAQSDVQQYYQIGENRNEDERALVEQALLYRHPLAFWVVATSQHDEFHPPDSVLDFLLEPIRLLFTQTDRPPLPMLDILVYMGAKYHFRADNEVDPDWQSRVSFSFWEHIQQPELLARSITKHIQKLFRACSAEDSLSDDSDRRKEIGVRWSELYHDIRACIVTDSSSLQYVVRLAESFIQQRDYSSATAVGGALYHALDHIRDYLPELAIWSDIGPENDLSGCQKLFASSPGLPYLSPLIHKLRTSNDRGDVSSELFRYVRVLGTERFSSSAATYGSTDRTSESGKKLVLRHNVLVEEKACEKEAILDRNSSVNETTVLSFSTCKTKLDAKEISKRTRKVASSSPPGSAIEELEVIQNRLASPNFATDKSTNSDRCGGGGDCAIDDDLWTDEEDSEKDEEDRDTFQRIQPLSILPPHQSLLAQTLHAHRPIEVQDAPPLSENATRKNMISAELADLCHDILSARETAKLARSCERCIGYRKGTPISFHHHEEDRKNILVSGNYEGISNYYAGWW